MFRAYYELGRYDFEAYGSTDQDALDALRAAVEFHVKRTGADTKHLAWVEDADIYEIHVGEAYRDQTPMSELAR